jgi:hypothetical protein
MAKREIHSRSRLSPKDTFEPKAKIKEKKPDRDFGSHVSSDTICYTMFGRHHILNPNNDPIVVDKDGVSAEENPVTFAKVTVSNNTQENRYFIKCGRAGRPYDPSDMYAEGTHAKFNTRHGTSEWRFKEVNHKAFDNYLAFLRTKNKAYYQCAEREIF